MKLTRNLLHSIGQSGRGFNSAQLKILGVKKKSKGWLSMLIGNEVSEADWLKLNQLRGMKPRQRSAILSEPQLPLREATIMPKCELQFRRVLQCLEAGEKFSALDHAKEIIRLIETT